MANSPLAVWSVFLGGILVALILLAGFVAAVVLSQRRYLNLHRSHARKILDAQEKERAFVAREVHEGGVQWVGALERDCENLERQLGAGSAAGEPVAALRGQLRELAQFLRGLAHRLHPSIIDRAGLVPALTALCQDMEQSHGIRVTLEAPAVLTGRITPDAALVLYRIAQEAVQNAVKHAAAPEVKVELASTPAGLDLVIRDQGLGFDSTTRERAAGIGLLSMRERAANVAGSLTIRSAPGQGTVIHARVPFQGTEPA